MEQPNNLEIHEVSYMYKMVHVVTIPFDRNLNVHMDSRHNQS